MDEAYQSIEKALQINPNYSEGYNNLGVILREEGNIDEAIAIFDKGFQLDKTNRNASQNRLLALNCIYIDIFDIYIYIFIFHNF